MSKVKKVLFSVLLGMTLFAGNPQLVAQQPPEKAEATEDENELLQDPLFQALLQNGQPSGHETQDLQQIFMEVAKQRLDSGKQSLFANAGLLSLPNRIVVSLIVGICSALLFKNTQDNYALVPAEARNILGRSWFTLWPFVSTLSATLVTAGATFGTLVLYNHIKMVAAQKVLVKFKQFLLEPRVSDAQICSLAKRLGAPFASAVAKEVLLQKSNELEFFKRSDVLLTGSENKIIVLEALQRQLDLLQRRLEALANI